VISELLGLDPVGLSIKRSGLRWFGHLECKDDADWLKWCMESENMWQMGHPRKIWWWDYVWESFGLSG